MNLSILLAAFKRYWADISTKGDAALYSLMWACGLPGLVIGLSHRSLLPPYFVMIPEVITLTSFSILAARITWPRVLEWILGLGVDETIAKNLRNIFRAMHYLEQEFVKDVQTINALTLSDSNKARLQIRRYQQYQSEREQLRALISSRYMNLTNHPSES